MADDIIVGILRALLKLDTADFETNAKKSKSTTDQLEQSMLSFGKTLTGAFTATAIIAFGREVLKFADDIGDLSTQTGISTSRLQALNYVMAGSGVTVDDLANGIAQLSKRLVGGDTGAANAIRTLGLNVDHLIAMKPDQAFIAIGEAVSRIPNPMERSAIMMELFGRNGSQYLKAVTADMGALVAQVEKTGPIMSENLIDRADQFDKAWERGKIQVKAMTAALIEFTAEALETQRVGMLGLSQTTVTLGQSVRNFTDDGNETREMLAGLEAAAWKNVPAFKSTALSMGEAHKVAVELDKQVGQKLAKAHEDAAAAAKKSADETAKAYAKMYSDVLNAQGLWQMEIDKFRAAPIEDVAKTFATVTLTEDQAAAAAEALIVKLHELQFANVQWHTTSTQSADDYNAILDKLIGNLRANGTLIEENKVYTDTWQKSIGDLSQAFMVFSQIAGDSLGRTFQLIGANIAGIDLANKGIAAMKGGFSALGGGNILSGLAGIATGIGGIASAAAAAVQLVMALWSGLKKLFGGGEEGTVVNPARDQFWQQYGGYESASTMLTKRLEELGDSDPGGTADNLIKAAFSADTKEEFDKAQDAIISLIGGSKFHGGGLVGGVGNVMGLLRAGERVLTGEQNEWFSGLMRAMPAIELANAARLSTGGAGRPLEIHIATYLDGRVVARQVLQHMPYELAAHGVK